MKIKPNQHINPNGFIQLPVLIIALIAVTISGVTGGYYVNKQIKKTDVEQSPTVATTTEEIVVKEKSIDLSQYEINNAEIETKNIPIISEDENNEPTFSFQEKIKPVVQEEDNTKEEVKKEVLSYLNGDIDTLNDILEEIIKSRERYIDYAEEATKQRKQSLVSLLSISTDTDLRNFIQKGVDNQQSRLDVIREDYETSFGFIEDGLEEYIEKITFVRNEFVKGNETDDFMEYYFGADGQIDRFLSLLNEVNKMANNREGIYADAYTEYLGYIKNLNAVAQTGYSISMELADIERRALEKPKDLEINCWSTTETIGNFFDGKTQTTFRCE